MSSAARTAVTLRALTATPPPLLPSPDGVNFARSAAQLGLGYPLNRWGGNAAGTRYAWDIDATNRAADWYFESLPERPFPADVAGLPANSTADRFLAASFAASASVLLTVPTIGWAPASREPKCSFAVHKCEQRRLCGSMSCSCLHRYSVHA